MTDRIWFQRAVLVLWLLWSVTLLTMYYEQLWSLFKVGPLHWVRDTFINKRREITRRIISRRKRLGKIKGDVADWI